MRLYGIHPVRHSVILLVGYSVIIRFSFNILRMNWRNETYDREIKMYFYLANVGFEPTPTSTAAPSNAETTVIPTLPLRSLKNELS